MQRQRNFLLPGGRFVCETGCRQSTQGVAEIKDVKVLFVVTPGPIRLLVASILGRRVGKRLGFALQRNVNGRHGIKVRRKKLLMAKRIVPSLYARTLFLDILILAVDFRPCCVRLARDIQFAFQLLVCQLINAINVFLKRQVFQRAAFTSFGTHMRPKGRVFKFSRRLSRKAAAERATTP